MARYTPAAIALSDVNGGEIPGRGGGAKAGQWREDGPTCKGAQSGPFACRRRERFNGYGWMISPVSGSTLSAVGLFVGEGFRLMREGRVPGYTKFEECKDYFERVRAFAKKRASVWRGR